MKRVVGRVFRVNGPVVEIEDLAGLSMLDMVEVGKDHLIGEIVHIKDKRVFVQVYEDTTSLKPDEEVYSDLAPLCVELGPGLLGNIYDGIQRPLEVIKEKSGFFIKRGFHIPSLSREKKWDFYPLRNIGEKVFAGEFLGEIKETPLVNHKVMVPPNIEGRLIWIAEKGKYSIEDRIALIEKDGNKIDIFMYQKWPIRKPRPYLEKLEANTLQVSGQRIIDTLFPIPYGGRVGISGGFGTGKTVIQHQLAKYIDADVVVFIGCGERGNEMANVLLSFPNILHPKTKRPISERTIFIANTSDMPVAAREASIYTGITIAEYYRDMGLNVALMADSTSRWAEALRELSARLEEMPLEEGFPAYLAYRLAEFYERAGSVKTLSSNIGSVSIFASISPPGGDFSEPVTTHTKRFIRAFWALDKELANARHYPSISWIDSYSEYVDILKDWYTKEISSNWFDLRSFIMELLQKEQRLLGIVKLVGVDVLPHSQRLILEICNIFKNVFLQQNAFDEVDAFSSPKKQFLMLKIIVEFYKKSDELIRKGITIVEIKDSSIYKEIVRMKRYKESQLDELENLYKRITTLEEEFGIL